MTDLTHQEQAEKLLDELEPDDDFANHQFLLIAQVEATLALVDEVHRVSNVLGFFKDAYKEAEGIGY